MSLLFTFKEFLDEIAAFSILAAPLLDASAGTVLGAYAEDLRVIRDSRNFSSTAWEIPRSAPLKSIVSQGKYEPAPKRGGHHVQAHISSTWTITPVKPKGAKSVPVREFHLTGLASTKVELRDTGTDKVIALWKMEIGNKGAPGCHFHTGIGGDDGWETFPSTLSVPRLPGFLVTPMAVCEYVLNEIFQDDWPKTAAKPHARGSEQWSPIQRRRLLAVLKWKYDTVFRGGRSSPWCDLKGEKPESDAFSKFDESQRLVTP